MAKHVQQLGHTGPVSRAYRGRVRQITVNLETWRVHVHDGLTAGGHALALVADLAGYAVQATVAALTERVRALETAGPTAFQDINYAAALEWNVNTHPNAKVSVTGDMALTITGDVDGGVYTLEITMDAVGSHAVTFPAGWKWRGGRADAPTDDASATSILTIRRIGADVVAAPLLRAVA